jgi:hypothetical protein
MLYQSVSSSAVHNVPKFLISWLIQPLKVARHGTNSLHCTDMTIIDIGCLLFFKGSGRGITEQCCCKEVGRSYPVLGVYLAVSM